MQQNNRPWKAAVLTEPLLVLGGSLLFIFLSFSAFFETYELKTYDFRFRLKSKPKVTDAIVHIDIDDKSLALVGKWPWTRDKHATLIEILNECGVKIIAFDILFIERGKVFPKTSDYTQRIDAMIQKLGRKTSAPTDTLPSPDNEEIRKIRTYLRNEMVDEDKTLANAIAQSEAAVFLPFYISSSEAATRELYASLQAESPPYEKKFDQKIQIFPEIAGKINLPASEHIVLPAQAFLPIAHGSGFVNTEPDIDGTMRRTPTLWRVKDAFYAQMFLAVALRYLGVENPTFKITRQNLLILQAPNKVLKIPITSKGEMFVHWAGLWNTVFRHIPYSTILSLKVLRNQIDDLSALLDQKYSQGEIAKLRDEIAFLEIEGRSGDASALEQKLNQKKQDLWDFFQRNLKQGEKPGTSPEFQEFASDANLLKELASRHARFKERLTSEIRNKIAIVGLTATGTHDIKPTPLQAAYPMVGMNSNVINTLLTQSFIREAPRGWNIALIVLSALAIYGFTLMHANWRGFVLTALYLLAYTFTADEVLNRFGLWIHVVAPMGCSALTFALITTVRYTKQEIEKRWIKSAFKSYLSEAVVEEILADPAKLKLGGEMRNMSLLFADIRDFTALAEQFDAEGLTQFINRFLTPMTDLILKRRGTIDKYMGDCIMAFWNAPLDDPEHADHACRAALDMRRYLVEFNQILKTEAETQGKVFQPIRVGIGINTGDCCVGNVGSVQRFDYSVLGDDVNLASRLEGQSRIYGVDIVIGQNTLDQVKDYVVLELDLLRVKGKTKPVRIFALLGDESFDDRAGFEALRASHDAMLAAYRAQKWQEARALLEECLKLDSPKTRMRSFYQLFLERIQAYQTFPPGENWDGVTVATIK